MNRTFYPIVTVTEKKRRIYEQDNYSVKIVLYFGRSRLVFIEVDNKNVPVKNNSKKKYLKIQIILS